jgi:hypothetical protein
VGPTTARRAVRLGRRKSTPLLDPFLNGRSSHAPAVMRGLRPFAAWRPLRYVATRHSAGLDQVQEAADSDCSGTFGARIAHDLRAPPRVDAAGINSRGRERAIGDIADVPIAIQPAS